MNWLKLVTAQLLLLCCIGPAGAEAPPGVVDPTAPVERLQMALVAATQQADVDQRQAALLDAVSQSFDLRAAGRLILRSAWTDLSSEQQARFERALGRLVAANFVSRFKPGTPVSFGGTEVSDLPRGRARVRTQLARATGTPVPFDYTVQPAGGQWRIVNLLVAGVSDIALRSAQYTRQLDADGFEAVLANMQAETEAALAAAR